ncbi:hypothetical protein [Malacoplasma penetrans HF-2]|uniref:Lipoprotein-associated type-17 domain-containing protein n=2 Tax=Malacoplasma penetrans TaxID=28227 RepID=Q8EX31_MALP2|nr:hypothetical protein [Malacoplasma penetrans HF-2]
MEKIMNKKLKNRLYISTLAISLTGTFAAIGSVALPSSSFNNSSSSEISSVSKNLNAATTTAATPRATSEYVASWNIGTQDINNLNSPIQNIAFNTSNTQYALLTTAESKYDNSSYSITSRTTEENVNFNALSVFKMSDGSLSWTKKASDIKLSATRVTSLVTGSKFVAVTYLDSYMDREAYYLAVVQGSDNKYYLVFLKEGDTTNFSPEKIKLNATGAGAASSSSTSQFYINVVSSSNWDINIYQIQTDTSGSSNNLGVNLFDLKNNGSTSTTVSASSLSVSNNFASISSELLSSYFYKTNGAKISSKLTKSFKDDDYVYFVFQQEPANVTAADFNNFVSILRLPLSSHEITISSESLYSLSLSSQQVDVILGSAINNYRPSVAIASNGDQHTVILSSKNSDKYFYSVVEPDMFNNSDPATFNELTSTDSAYIVSVNPIYNSDSSINSYVALLSNNKAIRINSDFSAISLMYDFTTLNATTSKLIFNIFTIPGDVNWYAQMTDGKIIQFNGTNLIGELGNTAVSNRRENSANVVLLQESQISSEVLFQKVTDNSNTSQASDYFKQYVTSNVTSFLQINSYDTAFGTPSFTADVKTVSKIGSTNNYSVTIAFSQNIRQMTNGSIPTTATSKVLFATQTYTFINENSSITVRDRGSVSASITGKLPSEITNADVASILNFQNVGNYSLTLDPNDTQGILTVQVKSDAVWINGSLETNNVQTITIGEENNPYFKVDLFNGLSSNIDLVTQDYIDQSANAALKTTLTNKYSTTLASQVTAQNIVDDFLVYGNAFSSAQLTANNIIQRPTADNVQLYPMDSEGQLYVIVTVPKIGDRTNVVYSFTTAAIFRKNFTTNHNVYLSFKHNNTVLNTTHTVTTGGSTTETQLSTLTPSSIVSLINSNKSLLFYFMDMSNYVFNILANLVDNSNSEAVLTIAPSDPLGTITFTINFQQQIPGLDSSYSYTFSGFTTANTNLSGRPQQMPGFSWGTIQSTALNGRKPTDITSEYLEQNFSTLFVYTNNANQLDRDITVTPLNGSGGVLVTITFYDWWEEQTNNGQTTYVKLAQKTFSTIIKSGLSQSREPINAVVWKSFYQLSTTNNAYTTGTASNALTLINSVATTELEKLDLLANISDYFRNNVQTALQSDPSALSLSIVPNDNEGTLSMYAVVKLDGQTYSYSSVLSGFNLNGVDYSVVLAQETSDAVQALKSSLPSNLTEQQIESLVNVSVGNGLTKNIQVTYDDIKGTLSLTVSLYKDGQVVATTTRDYSGFSTSTIVYNGTNALIIIAAVVIPIILLLTPILYISLFKNRRDIKKVSKVLDKRLSEQAVKKKVTEVNTIADLLNLETDKNW